MDSKVHSFLRLCFERSSIHAYTISWYLQLSIKLTSAEGTTEMCQLKIVEKHCCKNERSLSVKYVLQPTVSGVFEVLKFKISEAYLQQKSFPVSAQRQENFNFGPMWASEILNSKSSNMYQQRKFCTTSKMDRHLSRQKIRQRFSTNTLYSSRISRELAFYFTFCLEVNKNTRITENL